MSTVAVVGLGKLGLALAVTLADAGHIVLGWDDEPKARNLDVMPQVALDEPGVADLLAQHPITITLPTQLSARADVIFIVVPTQSESTGRFDSTLVEDVILSMDAEHVFHPAVIAIVSTVSPGTCQRLASGPARDRQLVYCPALIALGTVIHDLQHPPVQIIGASRDTAARDTVANVLHRMAPAARQMLMSWESAELAKLATNVFMGLKIAFANELGQLCDKFDADVDDVTLAMTANPLIGPKAFTPGAGFGGPCLPRDGLAYAADGGTLGLTAATLNAEHLAWVAEHAEVGGSLYTFAVLGRSYKPGTPYRMESFGNRLALMLHRRGGVEAELDQADVVVLALPLVDTDLRGKLKPGARVIDLWRTHGYLAAVPGIDYLGFGKP